MSDNHESEIRLAELIWRTVKLRIAILTLAIVCLLIVWSALITGNRDAEKVDHSFCVSLVEQQNNIEQSLTDQADKSRKTTMAHPALDPNLFCEGRDDRSWIETVRNSSIISPLTGSSLPDKVKAILNQRDQAFADYDIQRRAAYRLTINLSAEYSGGSVQGNALSVAETLPFCVFIALTVFVILGFQETRYRLQLRSLVSKSGSGGLQHADLVISKAQFFTGTTRATDSSFSRHFVCSPEQLTITALFIATLILLVKVMSLFILGLLYLTDTLLSSYPFELYLALSVLGCISIFTWRSYFPRSKTYSFTSRWLEALRGLTSRWPTFYSVGQGVLAALGILTLFLPWATEWSLFSTNTMRGYEFLLGDATSKETSTAIVWYQINPTLFREMRFQLCLALLFLVVCGFYSVVRERLLSRPIARVLSRARMILAALVLFFAMYFLLFLGILQYESVMDTPWLDSLPHIEGTAVGASLMLFNPAVGFWIFLFCCLTLALFSLIGD